MDSGVNSPSNSQCEDAEVGILSSHGLDFNSGPSHDDIINSDIPMDDKDKEYGVHRNTIIPMDDKEKVDEPPSPEIGMVFETENDAFEFYNNYARRMGFSIRVGWKNTKAGVVTRRKFLCFKEGFREKDRRDANVKIHRPETRTGCQSYMLIALSASGKYYVCGFEASHNHAFENPEKVHMLRSHRKSTNAHSALADDADSSGVALKDASKPVRDKAKIRENIEFLKVDFKNYLCTKRKRAMEKFDAGGLLEYFQMKQVEDISFFHAIQLDEDDQITNAFWADVKMLLDYERFGDVVCLDTTYRTEGYGRPFAPFIGVNHHKQTIIFGVALLYDESADTFEWLFRTFIDAMSGKVPKTILTDQDHAMEKAIRTVLPETAHRICVWHIYQNTAKYLGNLFSSSQTFAKDFSRCVYDYEEEDEFLEAWDSLIQKYNLEENEWMKKLFKDRERWALVYGRDTFCADIVNTQRSESLNKELKSYLRVKYDILRFFQLFQRLLDERRHVELQSNFSMIQSKPKLWMPLKILLHASSVYTPAVFEMFQVEFTKGMNLYANICSEVGTMTKYEVTNEDKSRSHIVTLNSIDDTISCSCRKYEFMGILCAHALKVLVHRNVMVVPTHYILKRWTQEASKISLKPLMSGYAIEDDRRKVVARRCQDLKFNIVKIATRAAEDDEQYKFVIDYLEKMWRGMDEITQNAPPEKALHLTTTTHEKGANHCEGAHSKSSLVDSVDGPSEYVESFYDEIEDQDDSNKVAFDMEQATKGRDINRKEGINLGECGTGNLEKGLKNKRPRNLQPLVPRTIPDSTCSPSVLYPVSTPPTLSMQGSYGSWANPMSVQYRTHAQQTDHHVVTSMYRPPQSMQNQHIDMSCQPSNPTSTQLLQDNLAFNCQESVYSTSQMSQESPEIGMRQQFVIGNGSQEEHLEEGRTPNML